MSIPKWRLEEYVDDGCAIFQCLNCYESLESRTSPANWRFCPMCGVEWDGEQIGREHYIPRWEYELGEKDSIALHKAHDRLSYLRIQKTKRCWAIERRDISSEDGVDFVLLPNGRHVQKEDETGWKIQAIESEYNPCTLIDVINQLVRYRAMENNIVPPRTEYRARIIDRPSNTFLYGQIHHSKYSNLIEAANDKNI